MITIFNMVSSVPLVSCKDITVKVTLFSNDLLYNVKRKIHSYYPTTEELYDNLDLYVTDLMCRDRHIKKVTDFKPYKYLSYSTYKCILTEKPTKELYAGRELTKANILIREGFKAYSFHVDDYDIPIMRGCISDDTYVWVANGISIYDSAFAQLNKGLSYKYHNVFKRFEGNRGGMHSIKLKREMT